MQRLFESRIVIVACWGKEAGRNSVGGEREMWGVLGGVCLFALGSVSVLHPIPRLGYGYEGFYIHWQYKGRAFITIFFTERCATSRGGEMGHLTCTPKF